MEPDVEFVIIKNRLDVLFEYNPKIVDIMHRFRGRFVPGPPQRWQFPATLRDEISKELRLNGFTVDDSHFTLGYCIKK